MNLRIIGILLLFTLLNFLIAPLTDQVKSPKSFLYSTTIFRKKNEVSKTGVWVMKKWQFE